MTMTWAGGIVLGLVIAQLIATPFVQTRRTFNPLLDMLGIIPGWTFFVQPMSTYDVAIDARRHHADGSFGDWGEVASPPARGWRHGLWAPEAVANSAGLHAACLIDRNVEKGRNIGLGTSFAYDTVLAIARAQASGPVSAGIQFALVRVGDGGRTIRFVSDIHA